PLTVLLAEDNEINALLATAVLAREEHRVHRVANGARAVDRLAAMLAASTPPDLVLMDLQLPEVDGHAATRRIHACEARRGGAPPSIATVALPANAMGEHGDACLAAGMNGYLVKPFDNNDIRRVLADIARASGGRQRRSA